MLFFYLLILFISRMCLYSTEPTHRKERVEREEKKERKFMSQQNEWNKKYRNTENTVHAWSSQSLNKKKRLGCQWSVIY